jgi:hypothetical protein
VVFTGRSAWKVARNRSRCFGRQRCGSGYPATLRSAWVRGTQALKLTSIVFLGLLRMATRDIMPAREAARFLGWIDVSHLVCIENVILTSVRYRLSLNIKTTSSDDSNAARTGQEPPRSTVGVALLWAALRNRIVIRVSVCPLGKRL